MYIRNSHTKKTLFARVSVLIFFSLNFELYFGHEKRQLIIGHVEEKREQIYTKTLSKKYNSVKQMFFIAANNFHSKGRHL